MIRKNVAEILQDHVTFELEAIDRMYLNAYGPSLQTGGGFVYFVKTQLGAVVPSTMMVAPRARRAAGGQGGGESVDTSPVVAGFAGAESVDTSGVVAGFGGQWVGRPPRARTATPAAFR
jgi:hypothetical protein